MQDRARPVKTPRRMYAFGIENVLRFSGDSWVRLVGPVSHALSVETLHPINLRLMLVENVHML